jgi:hypothetical protein
LAPRELVRSRQDLDSRHGRVHASRYRQREQKLMLAILCVMVGGVMMLVLVVLAVVVVGIKQEPSAKELSSRAPSVTTAWVRRLIGVYVRKPDQPRAFHEDRGELPVTAWNPPRWPRRPAE